MRFGGISGPKYYTGPVYSSIIGDIEGSRTVSPRIVHSGGRPGEPYTSSTPVVTEVYICEMFVPCNLLVTGIALFNGSDVTDSVKVGLADMAGEVVATSASTQMSGADSYQRIPFTAVERVTGPSTYYVLAIFNGITSRFNTHSFGNFGASKQTGQVYGTGFTTITAPTTFTAGLGPIASLY